MKKIEYLLQYIDKNGIVFKLNVIIRLTIPYLIIFIMRWLWENIITNKKKYCPRRSYPSKTVLFLPLSPSQRTNRFPQSFLHKGKAPTPQLSVCKTSTFLVRLQGLEPWTNRLRVYCSTNWAKSAYLSSFRCALVSSTCVII